MPLFETVTDLEVRPTSSVGGDMASWKPSRPAGGDSLSAVSQNGQRCGTALGQLAHRHVGEDRCRLYFNQPRRFRSSCPALALSGKRTQMATMNAALDGLMRLPDQTV